MTSCQDIRRGLEEATLERTAEVVRHLEACPACTELAEAHGELARLLDLAEEETPLDLDTEAGFSALSSAIAERRGSLEWLKERPTWMRRTALLATAFLLVVAVVTLSRRPDLALYPFDRMCVSVGALAFFVASSLWLGSRPVFRSQPSGWMTRGLVGAGLLVALTLAAIPSAYVPPADLVAPMPATPMAQLGFPCLMFGLMAALPVYLLARVFDRGGNPLAMLFAALAAGTTGNLVLQLHCPASESSHLVSGHFGVVALFVGGVAFVLFVERRLQRKA